MTREISKMSAKELIEFERNGGENGTTSDLCSELSDKLLLAITYLEVCIKQCQEYSENELVIDWDTNKSYEISELKKFIGKQDESTTSK